MFTCRRSLGKLLVGAILLVSAQGCTPTQDMENDMSDPAPTAESPNRNLLDEANAANLWFHAKKVKPIWAKQVEEDQTVQTMEGQEQVEAGDFLCRGVADEIWPQSKDKLEKKYDSTDEVDDDGWRKYVPKPDAEGVMAAQIDHPFQVEASWGKLEGKANDFLVKNFADRNEPYPDDVWVVDAKLFEATYEKVAP